MAYLFNSTQIGKFASLKPIHTLLRHTQMQRIRLLQLLKLRQPRQHILDRVQRIPTFVTSPVGEVRVILDEALEIRHQFLDDVFHVSMAVLEPDLVFFRDGDVFDFLFWGALVECDAVGGFFALLDGEQVVGHGLVGEFVDERAEEIHAAV